MQKDDEAYEDAGGHDGAPGYAVMLPGLLKWSPTLRLTDVISWLQHMLLHPEAVAAGQQTAPSLATAAATDTAAATTTSSSSAAAAMAAGAASFLAAVAPSTTTATLNLDAVQVLRTNPSLFRARVQHCLGGGGGGGGAPAASAAAARPPGRPKRERDPGVDPPAQSMSAAQSSSPQQQQQQQQQRCPQHKLYSMSPDSRKRTRLVPPSPPEISPRRVMPLSPRHRRQPSAAAHQQQQSSLHKAQQQQGAERPSKLCRKLLSPAKSAVAAAAAAAAAADATGTEALTAHKLSLHSPRAFMAAPMPPAPAVSAEPGGLAKRVRR